MGIGNGESTGIGKLKERKTGKKIGIETRTTKANGNRAPPHTALIGRADSAGGIGALAMNTTQAPHRGIVCVGGMETTF